MTALSATADLSALAALAGTFLAWGADRTPLSLRGMSRVLIAAALVLAAF